MARPQLSKHVDMRAEQVLVYGQKANLDVTEQL